MIPVDKLSGFKILFTESKSELQKTRYDKFIRVEYRGYILNNMWFDSFELQLYNRRRSLMD